jgi:hypothetical protein
MTTDNFCFYLQNRLIQTSQTGGQWYSDTSPFSIPCLEHAHTFCLQVHATLSPSFSLSGKQGVHTLFTGQIEIERAGNTKGGSIIVLMTSCLTGLD